MGRKKKKGRGLRKVKAPAGMKPAPRKMATPPAKKTASKSISLKGGQAYIETSADKLLELVKSKRFLSVDEASEALNVPEEKVEEWGLIFESSNFIRIHFPKLGRPVLMALEAGKEEGKAVKRPGSKRKKLVFTGVLLAVLLLVISSQFLGLNLAVLAGLFQGELFLLYLLIIIIVLVVVLVKVARRRK